MVARSTAIDGAASTRWQPKAAWSLWTLTVATVVVALISWIGLGLPTPPIRFIESAGGAITVPASMVYSLAFGTIGLLLATRRPRNLIGWLFLGIGLAMAINDLANRYIGQAIESNTVGPAHEHLAWFFSSFHLPYVGLLLITFLVVFPEGRLSTHPSATGVLAIVAAVLAGVSAAVQPGEVFWFPAIRNPFGAPTELRWAITGVAIVGLLAALAAVVLAAAGLYARYRIAARRSRMASAQADEYEVTQQQIRWIAYAGFLLALVAVPYLVLVVVVRESAVLGLFISICLVTATLIPLATAFAIFRYRLYDIDIIINRTLVYILLTAILGGVFAALTTLLQRLSVAISGNESDAAVVFTALVVAILVSPVRKPIEMLVDERLKPVRSSGGSNVSAVADPAQAVAAPQTDGPTLESIEEQLRNLGARIERIEARLPESRRRRKASE